MKRYIYLLTMVLLAFACKEEPVGQLPIDSVPPEAVTDVGVKNIRGGAIISYSLPEDEDLLYVKAVYSLKDGIENEVRASLYADTLKIEGFGDTLSHEVSVIAVDRSQNESPAKKVSINPLTPPVKTIGATLNMTTDFGGVNAFWTNENRDEVSVVILKEDHNEEMVQTEVFYTTMVDGIGSVRGLEAEPSKFEVYVKDRWGNTSESKTFELAPLYETQLDPSKFQAMFLPTDEPDAYGWVMKNLWDGFISKNHGFHTVSSEYWPQHFTFDIGDTCNIYHLKMYQRTAYEYRHGNPREFKVWGCVDLTPEMLAVTNENRDKAFDGWTLLADCESIKPSGLPLGQTSDEDIAWTAAGEEFVIPVGKPAVRYIRIQVTRNWSDGNLMCFTELELFGDDR